MIRKVLETIKKHSLIEHGDNVLVGLSGGPDSVCLLHLLHSISTDLCLKVSAVHINHMLRGEESNEDEEYVKRLCAELNIPLFIIAVDIRKAADEKGISLEEAGREARYEQFAAIADNLGASRIAVAHNKNDQAETVLMRIIRGTGLDGLKGIEYKRGRIVRPLLDTDRAQIEDYCSKYGLFPRSDSSNLKSIYTRNKIRLELIPYINRLFEGNIVESVYKMALLLKDDNDYIENISNNVYNQFIVKKEKDEILLDTAKLNTGHEALRKRVIRNALREVKGDLKGIENVHISNIIDMSENGRTGTELHLPGGIRIAKSYNVLKVHVFKKPEKLEKYSKLLSIPGVTCIEETGARIKAEIVEKPSYGAGLLFSRADAYEQFFDYEMLKSGINIRNRLEGDIFRPLKSKGTKKLKEYFIDSKIPRELRDRIPLIAVDGEIVWIIGYKISDKFKVTENTKLMLKLKYAEDNSI